MNAKEQKSPPDSGLGMRRTDYVVADAGLAVEVANMLQCFLPLLFAEVPIPVSYIRLRLPNSSRCSWASCSIYPSPAAALSLRWKWQPTSRGCWEDTSAPQLLRFTAQRGSVKCHLLCFMLQCGTLS